VINTGWSLYFLYLMMWCDDFYHYTPINSGLDFVWMLFLMLRDSYYCRLKYIYTVSQKRDPDIINCNLKRINGFWRFLAQIFQMLARCWVRWENESPFEGQLCQEYLRQKSLKSVNPFQLQSIMSRSLFWDIVYGLIQTESLFLTTKLQQSITQRHKWSLLAFSCTICTTVKSISGTKAPRLTGQFSMSLTMLNSVWWPSARRLSSLIWLHTQNRLCFY